MFTCLLLFVRTRLFLSMPVFLFSVVSVTFISLLLLLLCVSSPSFIVLLSFVILSYLDCSCLSCYPTFFFSYGFSFLSSCCCVFFFPFLSYYFNLLSFLTWTVLVFRVISIFSLSYVVSFLSSLLLCPLFFLPYTSSLLLCPVTLICFPFLPGLFLSSLFSPLFIFSYLFIIFSSSLPPLRCSPYILCNHLFLFSLFFPLF